ncbi:MAG: hypothetical protein ACYC5F_03830 [Thermoleophilia bacterium]
MVSSNDGNLLIVDRRMPYLKRRCHEIADMNPALTVIVDRRINQDPHEEPDRRIAAGAEMLSGSEKDAR